MAANGISVNAAEAAAVSELNGRLSFTIFFTSLRTGFGKRVLNTAVHRGEPWGSDARLMPCSSNERAV